VPDRHPYLDGPHPRAYAHRGWHLGDLAGLENTMAAFRRAVAEGFPYLEMDVHASADGVPVVHHDRTLDRTTDGTGPVAAWRADELTGVRVRGREPLPLLSEVLTELTRTRFTIELKAQAVVAPVLALLERLDAWDRVCLGSYHEAWLQQARRGGGRRLCTSMGQVSAVALRSRAWLAAGPLPPPARGLAERLLPPVRGDLAQLPRRFQGVPVVDADLVRAAHASGREVHVWTVDEPAEMAALLDAGADGILTDRPDLLRALLTRRDQWAA
jgi:glycerophosphoryl diester phosphodiesterase